MRTGYIKDEKVIFPEDVTHAEIIATISHINNSELAAAKMFLNCVDVENLSDESKEYIQKAINCIKTALKVNYATQNYILKP